MLSRAKMIEFQNTANIYGHYFCYPCQFLTHCKISCGCLYSGQSRSSSSPTTDVDGDDYSHAHPCIEYDAPYETISVSSVTPTSDVDAYGYMRPQPSIEYIESHQAISKSPDFPTDSTPSSSDYCYVTPASLQHQVPEPPVTGRDAGTLDSE